MKKFLRYSFYISAIILLLGFLIPQNLRMPVKGGNAHSYNPESFWYGNWGSSGVHKGVDIFATKGTPVTSATPGIVLFTASYGKGGNFVVILGPKWRIHYYAHLNEIHTRPLSLVSTHTVIGTVGNTGNAKTTPSHLHYSIATLIPYPWRMDNTPQGWKKMFYLNPITYLENK